MSHRRRLRTTRRRGSIFAYPAVIHAAGMSSTNYMPLLGADWTASYRVAPDRRHISGRLLCPWAEATETIERWDTATA